ncbi:IS30 family transposase [Nonomuraea sp. NPDC003754]
MREGFSNDQACRSSGSTRTPAGGGVSDAMRPGRTRRLHPFTRWSRRACQAGMDRTAETVRDTLTVTMATLPTELKRSLTWDQGSEMALHHQFAMAADLPVYFCDPHSPWQRGSNENANGLRQYFPKGTDLSIHSPEHLAAIAARLNCLPRKTLDWETPAERLAKLLATAS